MTSTVIARPGRDLFAIFILLFHITRSKAISCVLTCSTIWGIEDVVGGITHKGTTGISDIGRDVEMVRIESQEALLLSLEE